MSEIYRDKQTLEYLYWERCMPISKIAERLGCAESTILRWMNKNDIETRDKNPSGLPNYTVEKRGYVRVLHNQWEFRLHRLLAVAKYGFDDVDGMSVHHKNEVKWDNRHENIELMSNSEHWEYHANKWDISQRDFPEGEEHPSSVLTQEQANEIRNKYEGTTADQRDLADEYGVCKSTIGNIVRGENY